MPLFVCIDRLSYWSCKESKKKNKKMRNTYYAYYNKMTRWHMKRISVVPNLTLSQMRRKIKKQKTKKKRRKQQENCALRVSSIQVRYRSSKSLKINRISYLIRAQQSNCVTACDGAYAQQRKTNWIIYKTIKTWRYIARRTNSNLCEYMQWLQICLYYNSKDHIERERLSGDCSGN